MRNFWNILKMDLGNLFLNPVLLLYNTVFGALIILILGFLSSGGYADSRDAYQYYTVTLLVYAMLSGAMTASNCFMERDIRKPNLRIVYSPVGGFPIVLSKTVASFVFDYGLHLLLLAALCPLLHVTLGSRPALFVLLMAPVEFASAALGIFFCCVFRCEETTSTLLSTVISLLCALGGTFFSLEGLGGALAALSRLSPVKWLNDAFFALACDNSTAYLAPVALSAAAFSALLLFGCRLLFRTEDYL